MQLVNRVWTLRWFRFLVVGALNTGFSYGAYALLVYCGLNYAISNFISLMLGIMFSFRTQSKVVFENTRSHGFLRYIAVWGVIYCLNVGTIALLMRIGLNAYVGGLLAIFPTAVFSYVLQKMFVFDESRR